VQHNTFELFVMKVEEKEGLAGDKGKNLYHLINVYGKTHKRHCQTKTHSLHSSSSFHFLFLRLMKKYYLSLLLMLTVSFLFAASSSTSMVHFCIVTKAFILALSCLSIILQSLSFSQQQQQRRLRLNRWEGKVVQKIVEARSDHIFVTTTKVIVKLQTTLAHNQVLRFDEIHLLDDFCSISFHPLSSLLHHFYFSKLKCAAKCNFLAVVSLQWH
jgi:hypothetical protein